METRPSAGDIDHDVLEPREHVGQESHLGCEGVRHEKRTGLLETTLFKHQVS